MLRPSAFALVAYAVLWLLLPIALTTTYVLSGSQINTVDRNAAYVIDFFGGCTMFLSWCSIFRLWFRDMFPDTPLAPRTTLFRSFGWGCAALLLKSAFEICKYQIEDYGLELNQLASDYLDMWDPWVWSVAFLSLFLAMVLCRRAFYAAKLNEKLRRFVSRFRKKK